MITPRTKSLICDVMTDKILDLLKGITVSTAPTTEMEICQSVGIYLQMLDGLNEGKEDTDSRTKGVKPDVTSAKNI